ncbi:perilipin-2 [Rhipicephalus microplus]|uniref:perilipin-2 n=1 Tax=Rhipicephalus microplus TaxID=6941 RepID=UPI003F6B1561
MPEPIAKAPPLQGVQSNFVNRLSELPAVTSLWETAAQSYARAKANPGLLAFAIGTAERSAAMAFASSKPVVDKLATPISIVDGLACKGLDKLEEVYPDVKKKPHDQIMTDAVEYGRKKYGDVKDYGINKINDIRSVSAGTVHRVVHPAETISQCQSQILVYAKQALAATEATLDQHIASLGIDMKKDGNEAVPPEEVALLARLDSISRKASTCASRHAALQLRVLQRYAGDSIARFQMALQVIQSMKQNLAAGTNQSFQEVLARMSLQSSWLQGLLSDPTDEAQLKNIQATVLNFARTALSTASCALEQPAVLVRGMSSQLQESYSRLLNSISDMLQTLTGVANISELTTVTLNNLHLQSIRLEYSVRLFTHQALEWLTTLPGMERLLQTPTEMTSFGSDSTQTVESSSEEESSADESL